MRALFISYDGLTSLLGQSQIWPYLRALARAGHRIDVLSYERAGRFEKMRARVAVDLEAEGITWHIRRFRSRPPMLAKLADLAEMRQSAISIVKSRDIEVVHARSYVACDAALAVKRATGVPYLFDMRGFWADERRDGGRWRSSHPLYRWLYRRWKAKEAAMIAEAGQIVVLAEAARAAVEAMPAYRGQPITVIPCAVDHDVFFPQGADTRAAERAEIGAGPGTVVLAYLGSIGTVYLLGDMLRVFARLKAQRGDAKFLFIGHYAKEEVLGVAEAEGIAIGPGDVVVRAAEHGEVPARLSAADLAIALRTQRFSSLGCSPTKLAEYFACGLPAIVNSGVGDVPAIVERLAGGAILHDFGDAAIDEVVGQVDRLLGIDGTALADRSRGEHDLSVATARYRAIYDQWPAGPAASPAAA